MDGFMGKEGTANVHILSYRKINGSQSIFTAFFILAMQSRNEFK
jgi:hypothetical protein